MSPLMLLFNMMQYLICDRQREKQSRALYDLLKDKSESTLDLSDKTMISDNLRMLLGRDFCPDRFIQVL